MNGPTPGGVNARDTSNAGANRPRESAFAPLTRPRVNQRVPVVAFRGLADVLSIVVAFLLANRLYALLIASGLLSRSMPPFAPYLSLGLLFSAIVVLFGLAAGAYRPGACVLQYVEMRAAVRSVWLGAAILFALLFVLKIGAEFSRFQLVTAVAASAITIVITRRLAAPIVRSVQRRRRDLRRVAIAGVGPTSRLLMKKILQAPAIDLELVGLVDDHIPRGTQFGCRLKQGSDDQHEIPVLGPSWDLSEIQREHGIELLLMNTPDLPKETADELLRQADGIGLDVGIIPGLGELRVDLLELRDITAIPVLTRAPILRNWVTDRLCRGLDVTVALVLLLVTSPLWVLIALAIRLDSRCPVFFRQVRIGKDGAAFVIQKFRSMTVDSDLYAISPSSDRDSRVTRVGRWIRLTGLDELPQLLNILKGEMALVGPRPEMPFIVESYDEVQKMRLLVRPGLTGLWQLSPDRQDQIHDNLEYDLFYVRNRSLLLDLLVLMETFLFTLAIPVRRGNDYLRERRWRKSGLEARGRVAGSRDPSGALLLALDQRVRGGENPRWASCLSAAMAAAGDRAVMVLVAPGNVRAMSRVIGDQIAGAPAGEPGDGRATPHDGPGRAESLLRGNGASVSLELVPYRGSGEVSRCVEVSRIVLTDMPHVRERALAGAGTAVVYLDGDGRTSVEGPGQDVDEPVLRLLSERLQTERASAMID